MKQMKYFVMLIMVISMGIISPVNAQSQNGKVNSKNVNSSNRGGQTIDKSNDAELQALIAETVDKFKVLKYYDEETKDTMRYNLFIPDNYDPSKKYPLVMFIGDASTSQKDEI